MNPIDELKQEHEGVKLSLEILSRMVRRLETSGESGVAEDMERRKR